MSKRHRARRRRRIKLGKLKHPFRQVQYFDHFPTSSAAAFVEITKMMDENIRRCFSLPPGLISGEYRCGTYDKSYLQGPAEWRTVSIVVYPDGRNSIVENLAKEVCDPSE